MARGSPAKAYFYFHAHPEKQELDHMRRFHHPDRSPVVEMFDAIQSGLYF